MEVSGAGFQCDGRVIPVDLVGWPTRTRESNKGLQESHTRHVQLFQYNKLILKLGCITDY